MVVNLTASHALVAVLSRPPCRRVGRYGHEEHTRIRYIHVQADWAVAGVVLPGIPPIENALSRGIVVLGPMVGAMASWRQAKEI
jgi:hypothetical protein